MLVMRMEGGAGATRSRCEQYVVWNDGGWSRKPRIIYLGPRKPGGLVLAHLVLDGRLLTLLGGDVGLVDVLALGGTRELVGGEEEEAEGAEAEHGPRETGDGGDARALGNEGAVLLGEALGGVTALEAVSEGSGGEDTSTSAEEDATSEEEEHQGEVAEPPVGETDEKVEDRGEEEETHGVVPHARGVASPVIAEAVELLRDETEKGDVDAEEEDKVAEDADLTTGGEEEAHAGGGTLG